MIIIRFILFLFLKNIKNWGPGVHLHLSNQILNDVDMQKCDDYEILKENRDKFLYGSIASDITLGKKYIKDLEKHSHTWKTGFNILNNAKTKEEIALGYGYISHLASDVIAHNFYIPKKMLISHGLRNFLHLVLEIKVDMTLYDDTYDLIKTILNSDFTTEDKYIKPFISKAVLPFGINKKIFEYSLKTIKSKYFFRSFFTFTDYENWQLENRKLIKQYHDFSYKLIKDIIINKENSILTNYDPNGEHNLSKIKELKAIYAEDVKFGKSKDYYIVPDELKL